MNVLSVKFRECEWNTLINGKITRLKGKVIDIVGDMCKVVGNEPTSGYRYTDIVHKDQLIFTNASEK